MKCTFGLLAILATATVASKNECSSYILRSRDLCQPTFQEIKDAFVQFMIVPQIIPAPPRTIITKYYNHFTVCLGNRIPPWETTVLPFTTWPNVNPNFLYTLTAIDPDYPQFFSTTKQLLIEMILNIPGANVAAGVQVTSFKPIAPPPGSGDHRYIYFIFKQPRPINITTELLYKYSTKFDDFSIADFIEEYDLGVPVSGNFFVSRQALCLLDCGNKETENYCEYETCKV